MTNSFGSGWSDGFKPASVSGLIKQGQAKAEKQAVQAARVATVESFGRPASADTFKMRAIAEVAVAYAPPDVKNERSDSLYKRNDASNPKKNPFKKVSPELMALVSLPAADFNQEPSEADWGARMQYAEQTAFDHNVN